ncbi:hypothetical protein FACS189431_3210 [Alphaproteobacteria bacterium]|nr:hypothetical protein FACS189431_3210 [Alphaproteobacteria bacterium]
MFRLPTALREKLACKSARIAGRVLFSLAIITGAALLVNNLLPSQAKYVQDDLTGSYTLTFNSSPTGMAGVQSSNNVQVPTDANYLTLTGGSTSGDFTTSNITPHSSNGWQSIKINGDWQNTADVKVQVLDCSNNLIPNMQIGGTNTTGIPLGQNNSINITALNSVSPAYTCLRFKVLLADTNNSGTSAPKIESVNVSWTPLTVYLINMSIANDQVTAGNTINYYVNYSVSFAPGKGTVVYAPIPGATAGTFEPTYGQNLGLTFNSASNGGQYTANEITVNDITVPANSVYWDLGDTAAGSAGSLSFSLNTQNGWQDGVQFETNAKIASMVYGSNGAQSCSVAQGTCPNKTSNSAAASVKSTPYRIINKNVSNTVYVNSESRHYVYEGPGYDSKATYNITYQNYVYPSRNGMETLFDPVLTDDLTAIIDLLTSSCPATPTVADRIINITNGGILDVTNKNITWTPANLAPNASFSANFTVDYQGCASPTPGTDVNNIVRGHEDDSHTGLATSDITSSQTVRLFNVPVTKGAFAKGEAGSIHVNSDDPWDKPTDHKIPYGTGTTTYNLHAANEGLSRLDDVVMRDMIPVNTTFKSATLPGNFGANNTTKIYVYTATDHTDPNTPPAFDYTNLANPGTGWTIYDPAVGLGDPTTVKWVTFYIGCLSSAVNSQSAVGECAGAPNSATGNITVTALAAANMTPVVSVCDVTTINNKGVFGIYNSAANYADQSDGGVTSNPNAIFSLVDNEPSYAYTPVPIINIGSSVTGPSTVMAGGASTYTINFANTSAQADSKNNSKVTINVPSVNVGGVTKYLEVLNKTDFAGATITDDGNGNWTKIEVDAGVLEAGQTKTWSLEVRAPRGVLNNTPYSVSANFYTQDINNCQDINAVESANTNITGTPQLGVTKSVNGDKDLIIGGDQIDYVMKLSSTGTVGTSGTFIVDKIPATTRLVNARCLNGLECEIYFASADNVYAAGRDAVNPFDVNGVKTNFTLGNQSGSVWTAPNTLGSPTYVAYLLKDNGGEVLPDSTNYVGLSVVNDDDGYGLEVAGSPTGTIITNYPIIISNQTLQAVGNTVHTTVLESPGLKLDKYSNVDVTTDLGDGFSSTEGYIKAGNTFEWYIDFVNNATEADTEAMIYDSLPTGTTATAVYLAWYSSGVLGGETNITSQALSANGQFIAIDIVAALGHNFAPGERGRVRIVVDSDPSLPSTGGNNEPLLNTAQGTYRNAAQGPYSVYDDSIIAVVNPDLAISKSLKSEYPGEPRKNESVTYTLIVQNLNYADADGVTITDTLPAGMCYTAGQTTSTGGYTLGDPVITGGPCATAPTTLTWTLGTVAKAPVEFRVTYKATVDNSVAYGTLLSNTVVISTTDIDEDLSNNTASASGTTPTPDPFVLKTASSPIVLPGEQFSYKIRYGNTANEQATGVYLVDGLPDINADGKTDITITSVDTPQGETLWFYDANVSGPLSAKGISATYNYTADGDFKASIADFATGEYPTHIIIVNTGKNNNNTLGYGENNNNITDNAITINALAVNPYTHALLDPGNEWTNLATIYSMGADKDLTNNNSTADAKVPNADLSVEKTADIEGAYPGAAPGDTINYTIKFKNTGVGAVCGIWVTDVMPSVFESVSYQFDSISITDRNGATLGLVDAGGNPIPGTTTVVPTIDTSTSGTYKWYLGDYSGSAADENGTGYLNVCLPQGAVGQFTISGTVDQNAVDGTEIDNVATIGEDSPANEEIMTNNTDNSKTVVYRSDLRIVKTATVNGYDGAFGTGDDRIGATNDTSGSIPANPTETIRYKLEYNNIGNMTAKDSVISEVVPIGTCYAVNSFANLPFGSVLQYSNDDGSTWGYVPVAGALYGSSGSSETLTSPTGSDCNVTNVRVTLGDLTAPANSMGGEATVEADNAPGLISAGYYHTCVSGAEGTKCWGRDNYGQLGDGANIDQLTAVNVQNLSGMIKKMESGYSHTAVLLIDGTVRTWGENDYGQLGDGTDLDRNIPVQVAGLTDVIDIATGYSHTCAVKADGTVWCWGRGNMGQIGQTADSTAPVQVTGITTAKAIAASEAFTAVVLADGTVQYFGNGNTTLSTLGGASDIKSIAAGGTMILMIRNSGAVYQSNNLANATAVTQLTSAKSVTVGTTHQCAIKTTGETFCWGTNDVGQTGGGTNTPAQVPGLGAGSTVAVAAGAYHTCAIKTDNTVACWGWNDNGQLGNGTLNNTPATGPIVTATGVTVTGSKVPLANTTTATKLQTTQAVSAYNDIFIQQTVGVNTFPTYQQPNAGPGEVNYYLKQVQGGICAIGNADVAGFNNPIFTAPANNSDSIKIDASGLPTNKDAWCIVANYVNTGDLTSQYFISYSSPDEPFVTFDAVVKKDINQSTINNTAAISTTTPEILTTNNTSTYQNIVPLADLSVDKIVDRSAVKLTDAVGNTNDMLTYTIVVTNHGSSIAEFPKVVDTLPGTLTYQSAAQTGGSGTFACSPSGQVVTCNSNAPLAINETATITVTAHIVNSVTADAVITNRAVVSAYTADSDLSNNESTANTTISTEAAIYTTKTGPASGNVHINQEYSYFIEFGDRGSADQVTGWSFSDTIDSNLTIVDVNSDGSIPIVNQSGVGDLACSFSGQVVSCNTTSGNLPKGAHAEIEVRVRVANNQALADTQTVITNTACSSTNMPQNIADDCGSYDVTVKPGNGGSVYGKVFLNRAQDMVFNEITDKGISGVTLTLTGTDTLGRTVSRTTTTNSGGEYFFDNIYPGTYTVTETQPSGYISVGSKAGTLGIGCGSVDACPIVGTADVNEIIMLVITDGLYAINNNFAEINGGIGNLIWLDENHNGYADPTEPGIAGVTVALYDSTGTTLIATTTTDGLGNYEFGDRTPGTYKVVVTDANGIFTSRNLLWVTTPSGHGTDDNYSKDPTGYTVTLTAGDISNTTADFGYTDYVAPVITVSKTDGRTNIEAGATTTYTITVNNTALNSSPVTDVVITDAIPANATFVSAQGDNLTSAPAVGATGNVIWTIPSVAYGTAVTRTVTVQVNSTASGVTSGNTVVNTATVASAACVNTGSNCTGTDTDTVIQHSPSLTITKSDGVSTVEADQDTEYTIIVTNTVADSTAATNVVVTDTLPTNTTYKSSDTSTTSNPGVGNTGNVVWTIPSVAYGTPVQIKVKVTVNSNVNENDPVVNNVTSNHSACASTNCNYADTDTVVLHQPEIMIDKSAPYANYEAGDTFNYTVTVSNTVSGSSPAANVVVTDTIPAGLTYAGTGATGSPSWNAGTKTLTWTITSVANGTPITLTIPVTVDSTVLSSTTIDNTATIVTIDGAACSDASCADNHEITIDQHAPALSLTKTGDKLVAKRGDTITYTITATNTVADSTAATNVEIVDSLPSYVTYVAGSADNSGSYDSTGNEVTWMVPSIAYGTSVTLTYKVTIDNDAPIVDTDPSSDANVLHNVVSSSHAACGTGCSADFDTTVNPNDADLIVQKTDNSSLAVHSGDFITYTITVSTTAANALPLTNVVVTDTIPGNVTLVAADTTAGYTTNGDDIYWTIPTLTPAAPVQFQVKVQVKDNAYGSGGEYVTNAVELTHAACGNAGSDCTDEDVDPIEHHAPIITVSKDDSITDLEAGDQTTYSITVTNTKPDSNYAQDVEIVDSLPNTVTYNSADNGGTYDNINHEVSWTIPSVAYGSPVTLTVTVTVNSNVTSGTTIHNYASINTATCPTGWTCTDDDDDTVIKHQPAIAIAKDDGVTGVEAGGLLTYTITATNVINDSFDASNITVTDTLPANTTFVSATGSPTSVPNVGDTGTVVWTIPSVVYGTPATRTVTVQVKSTEVSGGTVVNSVVTAHEACLRTGGDCDDTDTDSIVKHQPTLTITKDDGQTVVEESGELTYIITVTNTREDSLDAENVTVTDAIPTNATFVEASDSPTSAPAIGATGNVVWTIPSVAYGTPVTRTVKIKVNSNVNVGDHVINNVSSNHVACSNAGGDCTDDDDDTVVLHAPNITIDKNDGGINDVEAGSSYSYTITVANPVVGSNPATSVVVTDTIPTGLTYAGTGATGSPSWNAGTKTLTWTIASVANGTPITLTVPVTVDSNLVSGTTITNTAEIASVDGENCSAIDGAVCSEGDTNTVEKHNPVLQVSKTDGTNVAKRDQQLTYTITVANTQTDSYDADDVILTDVLPAGVTFVSASDSGSAVGQTVTWPTFNVAYGTAVTRTVTVTVNNDVPIVAPGNTITNTATVADDLGCGIGSVCSSTDVDTIIPDDADLTIVKTDNRTTAHSGDQLTYQITVSTSNTNALPFEDVEITDVLPANTTFVSTNTTPDSAPAAGANGTIVWTIGTLVPSTPVTIEVTVRVNDDAYVNAGSEVQNTASITSHSTECAVTGSVCSATDIDGVIQHNPVLTITKDDGKTDIEAGTQTTYTISVANTKADSTTATSVEIVDSLPNEVTFVSATAGGAYDSNAHEVVWTIPSVVYGTAPVQLTVTVSVKSNVTSGTTIHNYASISDGGLCDSCSEDDDNTVIKHQPSLTVTKTDGDSELEIGDTTTYTITLTNTVADSFDVTSVPLTDTLPAGLTFVSASDGGTAVGQVVTWPNITSVAYGTPVTRTVTATVNSNATVGGNLTNTATSTHTACGNTGSNCTGTDTDLVIPHDPTLTIVKDDSLTEVEEGMEYTYTITLTNTRAGSSTATGVKVTDNLPTNVTFKSATVGGAPVFTNQSEIDAINLAHEIEWTGISVANGTPVILTVTVEVNSGAYGAGGETVHNTVTAEHTIGCAATGADCADDDEDDVVLHAPALQIGKNDGIPNIEAGETTTYTITVTNTVVGSAPATGVNITDVLPAGMTYVSATPTPDSINGQTLAWTLASVANGTPATIAVVASVNSNVASGTHLVNTATIGNSQLCDTACTATDDNTVIKHQPDLAVTKTDSKTFVYLGDTTTYQIVVANTVADSYTANNVYVTDVLPADLEFVSASDSGQYSAVTNTVDWTISSLSYGSPKTLTITARVKDTATFGNTLTNTVTLDHAQCWISANFNPACEASDDTTIAPRDAKLVAAKTDGVETVLPGMDLTYQIHATNTVFGSNPSDNVTLVDSLPADLTFVSASDGGVYDPITHTVTWTLASVAYSQTITRTVTATVPADAPEGTVYTNTADLDHSDCALSGAVCSATDDTTVVYAPVPPFIPLPPNTGSVMRSLAVIAAIISVVSMITFGTVIVRKRIRQVS